MTGGPVRSCLNDSPQDGFVHGVGFKRADRSPGSNPLFSRGCGQGQRGINRGALRKGHAAVRECACGAGGHAVPAADAKVLSVLNRPGYAFALFDQADGANGNADVVSLASDRVDCKQAHGSPRFRYDKSDTQAGRREDEECLSCQLIWYLYVVYEKQEYSAFKIRCSFFEIRPKQV